MLTSAAHRGLTGGDRKNGASILAGTVSSNDFKPLYFSKHLLSTYYVPMPSVGCWDAEMNPTTPNIEELPVSIMLLVPMISARIQGSTEGGGPGERSNAKPAWELRVGFLEEEIINLRSKRGVVQVKREEGYSI